MSDGAAPTPVASGSLGETPFGHLMLYLYRRQQSGTLVVTDTAGVESRVRVHQGRAIMAQLARPAGDMAEGLAPLCALSAGSFAFYTQPLLERPTLAGQLDPYELLGTAFAQGHVRDDMVAAVVKRFARTPLRLQPGRDIKRLKLRGNVTPLLDLIRAAPASCEELLAQSPLPAQTSRRLIYLLIITHRLAPYGDRGADAYQSQVQEVERPPAMASLPPPQGINEVASGGSVAWQELSGSAGTSAVVRDPTRGLSLRPPPVAPTPPVDTIPDTIREAERMAKTGGHDEAIKAVEQMLKKHPQEVSLMAVRAYLIYDRDGRGKDKLPAHVTKAIDEAFQLDKEHPRLVLLRGFQRKHEGNLERASRLFKKAVQADPKNLEAQRELRLAKMRLR